MKRLGTVVVGTGFEGVFRLAGLHVSVSLALYLYVYVHVYNWDRFGITRVGTLVCAQL